MPKEPAHPVGKLLEQIRHDRGAASQRDFARHTLHMDDAAYRRVLRHGAGERLLLRIANELGIDHRPLYRAQGIPLTTPTDGDLARLEHRLNEIHDAIMLMVDATVPDAPPGYHQLAEEIRQARAAPAPKHRRPRKP